MQILRVAYKIFFTVFNQNINGDIIKTVFPAENFISAGGKE
jgi:hypothetical protein